ncbi:hypothetical protein NBRC110019_31490 [Neptunitalea chrysea]|uniref:Outer membrane protein beta-barrel family protein n=1 Tax=Neptunitalea chrysea TaxID=1647581 RepID=A0A9W6B7M4_9FLAO|nr:hypothetical protein [Neptunitalea chrysea]GLB54108.1 hypothetical protein NBRC110019_31490 [Neptunitalea chrysea]
MMKQLLLICVCIFACTLQAQEIPSNYKSKKAKVIQKIVLDTVPINNTYLEVLDVQNQPIDSTLYSIDFANATLTFSPEATILLDSVQINYLNYPEFLTRSYSAVDPAVIVGSNARMDQLYALQQVKKEDVNLFDGLNTSGSISRGITIGNNQNAVLNSQLDLQISGKLANDITLRASIRDDNIPIQSTGYSQRVREFDQIFVEIESKNWGIRAGDINLQNSDTYFMNYTKKVQGLLLSANLSPNSDSKTEVFASGAVVRGIYTSVNFTGQEGNQGPYNLSGSSSDVYVIIVSGSERVYVNGILLERGENNDYIIDYSTGEVIFTSKYPITSDMRIKIEYQYTDYNYTRYVSYNGIKHTSDKLDLGVYLYSENDAKNQPVQENLSEEQIAILQAAGDDTDLMTAPSASETTYDENQVQYTTQVVDGEIVYVYSSDENNTLFSVTFTYVGTNEGDYVLSTTLATGKVYEYVAPVNGVPQGSYAPITTLNAPTKLQVAVINGAYRPTEKTAVTFEGAVSYDDENLFSDIDDGNNTGFAGKMNIQQTILNTNGTLDAFANIDYIQDNFQSIERIYNIEFNRDWNIETTPKSNQNLMTAGLSYQHPQTGSASYQFEYLDFKNYSYGGRHVAKANLKLNKLAITTNSSYLQNNGTETSSTFARSYTTAAYGFAKNWVGVKLNYENNQQTDVTTNELTNLSQRYKEYQVYTGIGDSLNIFGEVGYKYRINDSIRSNRLTHYNTSHTYYINSQLIKNKTTNLAAYLSYRNFKYEYDNDADENSLNSRIQYSQQLWKGFVQMGTVYETNAGTVAQQEFSYVEVEAGQGTYTWNDYNENGIQEIDEFEVAQFQDQATYVRVFLPNQTYINSHQTKLSETLTINPGIWEATEHSFGKWVRRLYNQTSLLIDRKTKREGNKFNLNPLGANNGDDVLALNQSFQNTLFYNRGKQHYTTSYTFLNTKSKSLLAVGAQESTIQSHQTQFAHQINTFWLVNFTGKNTVTTSASENYESRNYEIDSYSVSPTVSYFLSVNSKLDFTYQYQHKQNQMGDFDNLEQHNLGFSFNYSNAQKISLNGKVDFYQNTFDGNAYSAVGYQILEGLQEGKNFTWTLIAQKQLTKFLDLNLSYYGRKSESSKTIHTGSVQLKAYF